MAVINRKQNWSAAQSVTLILASIPVLMFLLVVLNLVWWSIPAIREVGLAGLFSTEIGNQYKGVPGNYGLMPALWGTIQLMVLAMAIAFPAALALALLATEYSFWGIDRPIEVVLSLFAGIPPIIYGLFTVFFAITFMRPKLAGEGLSEQYIRSLPGLPAWTAGMLPNNQSTLIGGVFLALLIIPFMAPLILDAIRNVPHSQKEASYALGASRLYTLRRVILPGAASGIIAAVGLGLLKAMGDVIIAVWAIGFIHLGMPSPLWDILEDNAPLTSTAAGLLGDYIFTKDPSGTRAYVSYFAALLLLILAFVILTISSFLQRSMQRRHAR
jgi:phosphate transport system permease protein